VVHVAVDQHAALVIRGRICRPAHCVEATRCQPCFGRDEQRVCDGLIVDALEEAEEADPIAVELVMRTVLDRGDAADRVSIAEREEQLPVGLAVERICLGVERVADGDAQWRNPLRMLGGVIDLPWEIDEAAQIPRRTD